MLRRKFFRTTLYCIPIFSFLLLLTLNLKFSELYEARSFLIYEDFPIEILKSDTILSKVSAILKQKNFEVDVHKISESFDVRECKGKACIIITARNKSPELSVELANTIANVLRDYIMQNYIVQQSAKGECQYNPEISKLRLRKTEMEFKIAELKEVVKDPKASVAYDDGMEKLADKYLQLELAMIELQSKYSEKHPDVIAIKSQIELILSRIKEKIRYDIKKMELEKNLIENELSELERLSCIANENRPIIEKAVYALPKKEHNPVFTGIASAIALASIILIAKVKTQSKPLKSSELTLSETNKENIPYLKFF